MNETPTTLLRGVYAVVATSLVAGVLLGLISYRGFVGIGLQAPSILDALGYGNLVRPAFVAGLVLIGGGLALGFAAMEFLEPE